jgi:hypothetical protein
MLNGNTVDITPTPRILRTLGEIPFQVWQCIAELVDNSVDAYLSDEATASEEVERKINVSWTGSTAAANDRTVEITDNAKGMSINQLQNAVKAGYSSNDPIGNLGLFGMGFNIATARLGELTTIMSTRIGDNKWVGVEIDFQKLIDAKGFNAPIIYEDKENIDISGTKIKISRLKNEVLSDLSNRETEIRQRLEAIYTPLLSGNEISIYVKGRQLKPQMHCVWSPSRSVRYNDQLVPAWIDVTRDLGDALFNLDKNCYLTGDEAEQYYVAMQEGKMLPANIVERRKRLTGWLGIQRYADPNDYGIDFIRNGRKILISDKSLFYYENMITGQKELQYPVDLTGSVGGRIVGELRVDYLLPPYQKNDFNRSDKSWQDTIEAICGIGPFLPQYRKTLGFPEPNTSPLGILISAYRRPNTGTKSLFAPNSLAKSYAAQFRKGVREYIDDTLWWKAAQEEDQKQNTGGARATTEVNIGDTPSDDVSAYLGGGLGNTQTITPSSSANPPTTAGLDDYSTPPVVVPIPETSSRDELIQRSTVVSQLSGRNYKFGNVASMNVHVRELNRGDILSKGDKKPCFFYADGIECDFIYNPVHPLLAQYPITPKMLLLQYLAERCKALHSLTDVVAIYSILVETTMPEAKIDRQSLQEKASSAFSLLREKLAEALKSRASEVVAFIHESSGEVEDTLASIVTVNSALALAFQNGTAEGFGAIDYVPSKTLYRLVEKFPEDVFDGNVLSTPYTKINLPDEYATKRIREESKDRALSFIKDALRLISNSGQAIEKNELARASLSVDFLLKELNT